MILSTRRALFIGDFRSWVSHAPRHETSTATSMRRADSRPAVLRAARRPSRRSRDRLGHG